MRYGGLTKVVVLAAIACAYTQPNYFDGRLRSGAVLRGSCGESLTGVGVNKDLENKLRREMDEATDRALALGPTQVPAAPDSERSCLTSQDPKIMGLQAPRSAKRASPGPTAPRKKHYLVVSKLELREAAQPLINALLADGATHEVVSYKPHAISVALPKHLADAKGSLDERAAALYKAASAVVDKFAKEVVVPWWNREL